jgi:hypothetical protein
VAGLLLHSNAHSFWIDPSVMQGIWELRDSSRSTGRGGKSRFARRRTRQESRRQLIRRPACASISRWLEGRHQSGVCWLV